MHCLKMFIPHAKEILTKSFDLNNTKLWAFWQQTECSKPYLKKCWRHFGRRFCSWNNYFILDYLFQDYQLSVFKNYGSSTRVTRLKLKMADSTSTVDLKRIVGRKYLTEKSFITLNGCCVSFLSGQTIFEMVRNKISYPLFKRHFKG